MSWEGPAGEARGSLGRTGGATAGRSPRGSAASGSLRASSQQKGHGEGTVIWWEVGGAKPGGRAALSSDPTPPRAPQNLRSSCCTHVRWRSGEWTWMPPTTTTSSPSRCPTSTTSRCWTMTPASSACTGPTSGRRPSRGPSSTAPAWRRSSLQVLPGPCPHRLGSPPGPWCPLPVPLHPLGYRGLVSYPHSPQKTGCPTPHPLPCHPSHHLPAVPPDLPNAHGLAVDWMSRNLFWTSYDTNKKQINVARLDGSFKNAVVQGLEQPHGLVVHPLRGSVQGQGQGTGRGRADEDAEPPLPPGSCTGPTVTTSAWPTWTAATAPCSSAASGALWV